MAKPKIPLGDTVSYRCGYDLTHPRPVVFDLMVTGPKGTARLPTVWSIKDAEEMAYALLKQVELCRQHGFRLASARAELAATQARLAQLTNPNSLAAPSSNLTQPK